MTTETAKMGRPRLVTADLARAIVDLIRRGYSADDAAIEHGIHPETFRRARRADPFLSDRAFRAHRDFIAERAALLARARDRARAKCTG